MKLSYFEDTDTLHIELAGHPVDEFRDWDENTLLELDEHGQIIGITIEHAGRRVELDRISLSGLQNRGVSPTPR